ncbi:MULTISPECIES: hypothetical protein, partial [unclassified Novosphingobium]
LELAAELPSLHRSLRLMKTPYLGVHQTGSRPKLGILCLGEQIQNAHRRQFHQLGIGKGTTSLIPQRAAEFLGNQVCGHDPVALFMNL